MTAHAMAGDREKSLAAGMNDHVAKPIDPNELFTTLEKWIQPSEYRDPVKPPLHATADGLEPTHHPETPRAQSGTEPEDLPQVLPGFDIAQGLSRLQGNHKLYRKLLLDFNTKYASSAADIQQALSAGDLNQVHGLVHNIKGLAGNLSAIRVQAAATKLDALAAQALAGTPPEAAQMQQRWAELQDALEEALASCRLLDQAAGDKQPQFNEQATSPMPAELAQPIAERLRNAADMGNITELKAIGRELRSDPDTYGSFCDAIEQMAEDFDLDGIVKLCDQLESRNE